MFSYRTVIQLHHTDAAGVVFFGHLFVLAHDAYQAYMESIGCGLRGILEHGDYHLPIVHAEADFKAPLQVGDVVNIHVQVERLGESSFTLGYEVQNDAGLTAATVRTVHVALDPRRGAGIPLPQTLRAALDRT